ncbi:MAG: ferritin family protein [Sedimentisphaerales bacterium]|nr:ferritin family protein [Sedimentisphaerales bacterium]
MQEFHSLDDVLNFAISMEQVSHQFYTDLQPRMNKPDVRELLARLAAEELRHIDKLESLKSQAWAGDVETVCPAEVFGYVVTSSPSPEMSYKETIKLAMDKEHGSQMFYSLLVLSVEEKELKDIFQILSQQEAQHWMECKKVYDSITLAEN